jgi:hypothetical protein
MAVLGGSQLLNFCRGYNDVAGGGEGAFQVAGGDNEILWPKKCASATFRIPKVLDVTSGPFRRYSMSLRSPSMAVDVASTAVGRVWMSHRLRFGPPSYCLVPSLLWGNTEYLPPSGGHNGTDSLRSCPGTRETSRRPEGLLLPSHARKATVAVRFVAARA